MTALTTEPAMLESAPFPPDTCEARQRRKVARLPITGPWSQPIRDMLATTFYRLFLFQGHHLNDATLKEIGISWEPGTLNLSTGLIAGHDAQYFEPIAPLVMTQWMHETGGVAKHHEDEISEGTEAEPREYEETTNYRWRAYFLWLKMRRVLISERTDIPWREAKTIQTDMVKWKLEFPDYPACNRCSKGVHDYQVQGWFRYTHDLEEPLSSSYYNSRVLDASVAHTTAFLADKAPFRDGCLNTSECMTIMLLPILIAAQKRYSRHSRFPLALIAASGTHIRIHQACFDPQRQKFTVYTSPIFKLNKGVKNQWDEFLTLLGWIVAKPVGCTTD